MKKALPWIFGAAIVAGIIYLLRGSTGQSKRDTVVVSTGTASNSPTEDISGWQRMLTGLGLKKTTSDQTAAIVGASASAAKALPDLVSGIGSLFKKSTWGFSDTSSLGAASPGTVNDWQSSQDYFYGTGFEY